MAGGRVAGLADLGVQPEVGDQLAPVGEPADVADRRQERDGDDQVHARDGHQPARLGPVERVVRDRAIDRRDLAVEEVDLPQRAVERLAFLDRAARARPATPGPSCRTDRSRPGGPSAAGSRSRGSRSSRACAPRPTASGAPAGAASPACARRASTRCPTTPRPAAWPASARPAGRSSRAPAGCPVSLGETTTTRATCGSMIRAISHALPVTSNTTRSSAAQALREQLQHLRPRRDPPRGPHLALPRRSRSHRNRDARPTRSPSPSLPSSTSPTTRENRGQTTPTHPRSQRNRVSRRGGHRKARALRPIDERRPAHVAFSRRPLIQCPDRNPRPGRRPRAAVSSPELEKFAALPLIPSGAAAARQRSRASTLGDPSRRCDCVACGRWAADARPRQRTAAKAAATRDSQPRPHVT